MEESIKKERKINKKKIALTIIILLLIISSVFILYFFKSVIAFLVENPNLDNSNTIYDQNIKIRLKNTIQNKIFELTKDAKTIEDTRKVINDNMDLLDNLVKNTLKDLDYDKKYNINYGLYVITSNDGKRDNGMIGNTVIDTQRKESVSICGVIEDSAPTIYVVDTYEEIYLQKEENLIEYDKYWFDKNGGA